MESEFPSEFRKSRRSRGDSQRDASAALSEIFDDKGVSPATIARWENAERIPQSWVYDALAGYMGITRRELKDLLDGEDSTTRIDLLELRVSELASEVAQLKILLAKMTD